MSPFVIGSCTQPVGGLMQQVHFLHRPRTPRHAHTLTPSQVSRNKNDFLPYIFFFVLLSVGLRSWAFSSAGKHKGRRTILSIEGWKGRPESGCTPAPSQPPNAASLSSCPKLWLTGKKEKSEDAMLSFNSFLPQAGPDAQGCIFMDLGHKWDTAHSLVTCH